MLERKKTPEIFNFANSLTTFFQGSGKLYMVALVAINS